MGKHFVPLIITWKERDSVDVLRNYCTIRGAKKVQLSEKVMGKQKVGLVYYRDKRRQYA